jgi:hypothetical protein
MVQPSTMTDRRARLEQRLGAVTRRYQKYVIGRTTFTALGVVLAIISSYLYATRDDKFLGTYLGIYALVSLFLAYIGPSGAAVFFTPRIFSKNRPRSPDADLLFMPAKALQAEIRDLKNELDLLSISEASIQQRAEKLFKLHQYELEKYYDQTLRQSARIFAVGIISIFAGFAVIGLTFYLVGFRFEHAAASGKIIVSTLGAAGALLANFVGAIYVKMFSDTLASLTEFHNRLVLTHHLHFGNFLSAKIGDESLRNETLATMASALAGSTAATISGRISSPVSSESGND